MMLSHDTMHCIVIGMAGRKRARVHHDTARAHDLGAGCVAIQTRTRPARPTTRPARPTTRSATSHDTTGHRPTTLSRHGRLGRTARRLGSGCAPGASNLVLTQCTVLSHCLGHCS